MVDNVPPVLYTHACVPGSKNRATNVHLLYVFLLTTYGVCRIMYSGGTGNAPHNHPVLIGTPVSRKGLNVGRRANE
jgi:hypothetical protein